MQHHAGFRRSCIKRRLGFFEIGVDTLHKCVKKSQPGPNFKNPARSLSTIASRCQHGALPWAENGAAIQELNVKTVFDILKKDSKGTFFWLEAVHDLEAALARLRHLSAQSEDEFVVFRNADLQVIASSRNE